MDRSSDWFHQAQRDLRHTRHALEDQDYEWACFAA
jgi:HEPN domain-containing protein